MGEADFQYVVVSTAERQRRGKYSDRMNVHRKLYRRINDYGKERVSPKQNVNSCKVKR